MEESGRGLSHEADRDRRASWRDPSKLRLARRDPAVHFLWVRYRPGRAVLGRLDSPQLHRPVCISESVSGQPQARWTGVEWRLGG